MSRHHGSDSAIHLYDIPEFPGYDCLTAKPETEGDTPSGSESVDRRRFDEYGSTEEDYIELETKVRPSAEGKPSEEAFGEREFFEEGPDEERFIDRRSLEHVIPSKHPRATAPIFPPRERIGTEKVSPTRLNNSAQRSNSGIQNSRLKSIIRDPVRRKARAQALKRLETCSRRLVHGAHDEPQRVRELDELCRLLEPETEKTADQLFKEYTRKARKRQGQQRNLVAPGFVTGLDSQEVDASVVQGSSTKAEPSSLVHSSTRNKNKQRARKTGTTPIESSASILKPQILQAPGQEPQLFEAEQQRLVLIQNAEEAIECLSERVKGGKVVDRSQILAAERKVKALAEFVGRNPKLLFIELTPFLDKRS